MKIRPVWAELFRANRRTDVTKLIVAFSQFSKAPKNGYLLTADLSSLQTCISEAFTATLFSNVL